MARRWQYQELFWVPLNPAALPIPDMVYYQQDTPIIPAKYKKTNFIFPYVPVILVDSLLNLPTSINPGRICVVEAAQTPVAHITGQPIPVALLTGTYDNRAAEPLPTCCPCEID